MTHLKAQQKVGYNSCMALPLSLDTISSYTNLAFPLNVYAFVLHINDGKVDWLHYGLADEGEDIREIGAWNAQQRATELLLEYLPKPPCRILETGSGLGAMAATLSDHGYDVTAIGPDSEQIRLAEKRAGDKARIRCVKFEEFEAGPDSFDLVLFQESAQYIDTTTLFIKSYNLLSDGGEIVIMDETALKRTGEDHGLPELPLLGDTLAQAKQSGFRLIEEIDLTTQAAPTIDYLLHTISTDKERLSGILDIPSSEIDQLLGALQLYRLKYRDREYGYVLLRFKKNT